MNCIENTRNGNDRTVQSLWMLNAKISSIDLPTEYPHPPTTTCCHLLHRLLLRQHPSVLGLGHAMPITNQLQSCCHRSLHISLKRAGQSTTGLQRLLQRVLLWTTIEDSSSSKGRGVILTPLVAPATASSHTQSQCSCDRPTGRPRQPPPLASLYCGARVLHSQPARLTARRRPLLLQRIQVMLDMGQHTRRLRACTVTN